MKVRFENFLREKCEVCGKPAKWRCDKQDDVNRYWSQPCVFHYYCDKCVRKIENERTQKVSFCGEKMICVNTQDGEFTCTSCAEYANHDVLDFIENLKAENERLKAELQLSATKCNKLRYERLMAKALFLKELKHNGDYFYSSVGSKTWEEIEMQLSRISRVYEARAKRIKERK